MFPRISIVTTNLNGGLFLERTIQSVICQGYPNLEYIIVDGGSTDNSLSIIKKYESNIHYWISEPDGGMYEAIQKGFEQSTGEIMGWLNSDDVLLNNSLFIIAEIFHNNASVEWIEGVNTLIDHKDNIFKVHLPIHHFKKRYLLGNFWPFGSFAFIQQESTYWRRSLWNKVGGSLNTELKCAGDFELWLRFFDFSILYKVDTIIGAFRVSGASQKSIAQNNIYQREINFIIDSELDKLSFYSRIKLKFIGVLIITLKVVPLIGGILLERVLFKLDSSKKIEYSYSAKQFKV